MKTILPLLLFVTFITQAQVQLGGDIDGDSANDDAGTVAISSDGSVLAIGAVGYNSFRGQVRFFEFSSGPFGSSWVKKGNHILGESGGDFSGRDVALSSSGNIIAIGASANDGNGSNSGHVRIYENISGTWTQIGSDIDGEAADDLSGVAVSLSSDGDIVAIGARDNSGNGASAGHVRLYENLSGTWTQIGSDIDGETAGDWSGEAVSLSANGNIVAIGAPFNSGNGPNSGHVRIYENVSGTWTQIGSDIDGEALGNRSGTSLSISADGSIVAIGATGNDGNGSTSGHVRLYQNISGTWTQIGSDIDGEAENDFFGQSVALSSDAGTLAVGTSANDGNGNRSGHVRVYDLSNLLSSDEYILPQFSLYPNPFSNQITISNNSNLETLNIKIHSANGKLLNIPDLNYDKNTINLGVLQSGIYFLTLQTLKGQVTKKIIKQ